MSKDRLVQNVEEYLREVSTIKAGWPTPVLTFRGQKDKEWPLASSAERRLKASPAGHDGVPIQLFVEYHENLLKKCKLNNYDKRDGKQETNWNYSPTSSIMVPQPASWTSRAVRSSPCGSPAKNQRRTAKSLSSTRLTKKQFWKFLSGPGLVFVPSSSLQWDVRLTPCFFLPRFWCSTHPLLASPAPLLFHPSIHVSITCLVCSEPRMGPRGRDTGGSATEGNDGKERQGQRKRLWG